MINQAFKRRIVKQSVYIVLTALMIFTAGCGLLTANQQDAAESMAAKPVSDSEEENVDIVDSAASAGVPQAFMDEGIFSGYYEKAYDQLKSMSLEEKVGQMFLVRCPTGGAVDMIRTYDPGGFVLFKRDFDQKTKQQVIDMLDNYQNASKIPMILCTDEEGGTVVRVSDNRRLAKSKFLSPQELYKKGGFDAISKDAANKAKLLRELGINVNLAPVADVSMNSGDYMYARTFGKSAEETGKYVGTVIQAAQAESVSCTLKHFPGYGNNADTHTGATVDDRPYDSFVSSDFIPFQKGIEAGAESVLVSHNIVKCMDAVLPASLSPNVHAILRDDLNFTGVIMTDDLDMKAITSYAEEFHPAVMAVAARNDLIIVTDIDAGYHAVLAAVENGTLSELQIDRAVFRVLAWKYYKGLV